MFLRLSTAPHIRSRETTASLMMNVIIALVPCVIAGIYYFGVDAALTLAVAMGASVIFEYLYGVVTRGPVRVGDLSALVTGLILGLNLPPAAPWWMAVIGAFVAVILTKAIFGGIGDNFINPALTARAVLLASWPVHMTTFTAPVGLDTVASATPLITKSVPLFDLFVGNIMGSVGEVSKVMILLGLIYLLITRTITWHIPVVMVGTTFVTTWLLGGDAVYAVLSGGLLFGAVFMATDYTTSPMTGRGQIIYAMGCGLIVALIRAFGTYPEGVTYAILLMNIATPLIDKYVRPRVYGHPKRREARRHV